MLELRPIFVSPRPSAADTADLYISDKSHLSAQSHVRGYDSLITRAATKYRLQVLAKYVRPGSTIVEIGAGGGRSWSRRSDKASTSRASSSIQSRPSSFATSSASRARRHSVSCATAPRHDVVYFRDVISHFFDPIAEFTTINAATAPSGLVAFETGNLADVEQRYLRYFSTYQLPDHLFFFGDVSLDLLLAATGFERVATRRWSILPQLRLLSGLHRLQHRGTGTAENGTSGATTDPSSNGAAMATGSQLREVVAYLLYHVVPSRIGAVTPKAGRPQTTLVVARKTTDRPKTHLSA